MRQFEKDQLDAMPLERAEAIVRGQAPATDRVAWRLHVELAAAQAEIEQRRAEIRHQRKRAADALDLTHEVLRHVEPYTSAALILGWQGRAMEIAACPVTSETQ